MCEAFYQGEGEAGLLILAELIGSVSECQITPLRLITRKVIKSAIKVNVEQYFLSVSKVIKVNKQGKLWSPSLLKCLFLVGGLQSARFDIVM